MSGPATRGLSGRRLLVAAAIGVASGVVCGFLVGFVFAPVLMWVVASTVFLVWTWLAIGRMDAATTAARATREDPTVGTSHVVLLLASVASLGGVALLLLATGRSQDLAAAGLGVLSVAASWCTVHTVYTLGYAAAYYRGDSEGGIDFGGERPTYADFAYVGFTLGMTYQVSDTSITDPGIRRMVLRHTLLSYVLGAVVLAIAINLVAGLVK